MVVVVVVFFFVTHNFPVAVVNTLNTKTHSSKEMAEVCFENADVISICYRKPGMKSTLSLSSECVRTKLYKLCTYFTSHLHSSCGTMWYRTLTLNSLLDIKYESHAHISPHTYTAYEEWCGIGH